MKIRLLKSLFTTICCIFTAITAFGQVTTSSMSGLITDEKDAALPGVTVLATHTPSGTQYYAITDNYGGYRILNMRVGGPYSVAFSLVGYGKAENTGVNIALADNYVLDAVLKEEAISLDQVVVSAESRTSNMRSDRAGAITTMGIKEINNTPTVTRSLNDVLKATPQLFVSSSGLQIGGGSYRESFVTVDGAAFNNAFGIGQNLPASGSPISLDALEQISVSITPYDVRQSGFTGGSVNAVTRSGDNEFRGSAYTYFSNQSLRGKKVGSTTLSISDASEKTFGFRVGGPIIKNKLFFFANAEIVSNATAGPSRVAATTEHPYTNGRDNVARPTETGMNAIANYLKTKYNYDPGLYGGYSAKSPGIKILARIDWNINKDHKFNFRYSNTLAKTPNTPSTSTSGLSLNTFSPTNRLAMDAIYFQNSYYYQETNFSSYAGELNSRFMDGKLNNTLRASYSHQYEPRSSDSQEFPFVDIAVDGRIYTSFGYELFTYGNLRDVGTFNLTDELSINLGKHNLLAGVQFESNHTKNGFQRFGSGYYTFSFIDEADMLAKIANQTAFDHPYQFAITHSMKPDFSQNYPSFTFNQLSLYIQDEIRLHKQFKLIGGLRFDLPLYPDLDTYNPQVAKTQLADYKGNNGHYDTRQLPATAVMISPRAGFNWDLTGDKSLVLRGGTGLFTGRIPFVWIVGQAVDSGVLQYTYTARGDDPSKHIPTFTRDRLDMLNEIYPGGLSAQPANITSVTLMANDLKMPQTWKTSIALDVKLPFDIKGTLEGVYNKDINAVSVSNVGLKDPVSSAIPNYADNRLVYGTRHNSTLRDAYLLHNIDSKGYYYSLTAKLEKNNWHGLSAMIAYTHSRSKTYGDGWGDQVYSAYQNSNTVNGQNAHELGYASYVMPHRIIGSLSYRKEYAKNFATSVALFYEGGPQGRISYVYAGVTEGNTTIARANLLGDNGSANLIYVPYSKDELEFVDYTYRDAQGATQTYTAANQSADFWAFVNNDPYLKTRLGKYAERNGAIYPWTNQFDIKITQDFFIYAKGKRNTLQVGLDILNVGNLLNKNWGHKQYY
ncbi:MAG: carboxypeptidase regulatory-like domain-containing protein, partial [Prevotellaceae bacterium]|nr:carboxypeptidase regulatory-like domain-containing protein [Prevotellaceae bacterium]